MAIAIIGIAGIVEIVRLEEDVNLFYTFMIKGYVCNLYTNFVMILGQSEWDIMATPIHPASSGHAILHMGLAQIYEMSDYCTYSQQIVSYGQQRPSFFVD